MDTAGLARSFISPWLSSALVIEGNHGGVAQAKVIVVVPRQVRLARVPRLAYHCRRLACSRK